MLKPILWSRASSPPPRRRWLGVAAAALAVPLGATMVIVISRPHSSRPCSTS